MLSFIEQAATEKRELIAKNKDVNLQPVCKGESNYNENIFFYRKRRKQEETKNIFILRFFILDFYRGYFIMDFIMDFIVDFMMDFRQIWILLY